ncbi:hypothetical protein, partial [Sodaliphilus pleomorphus]
MKITIKKNHKYLSGWTSYDMTWKTEYPVSRNQLLQSVIVITKNPFSVKVLKGWATAKGFDFDPLFTDINKCKDDCKKINQIGYLFNKEYAENLKILNSKNKCLVEYSATLNPMSKPIKTAFETFKAYEVNVYVEYKFAYINLVFPSLGREKNDTSQLIILSGNKLKSTYGEGEAINKIQNLIEKYIKDCDSDEKFNALVMTLKGIRKEMNCRAKSQSSYF